MNSHFQVRYHRLVLLISLMLLCLPMAGYADDDEGSFARKVSGTWLFDPGSSFQILMNINADGTLIWSNSVEYNPDFPNGAIFGVWARTGKREITTTELGFLYDSDGTHFATGRVQQTFNFDKKFQGLSASFVEDIFLPDQDPTDAAEIPVFSFGGDGIVASRLNVIADSDDDDDDDDDD